MTQSRAKDLLQAIEDLKVIKKFIKKWNMPVQDVIIDEDLENYLQGILDAEVISNA